MASGNPTLDAAEQGSGMEPLNAGPKEPQAPQVHPARDTTIPTSLAMLPQNSTAHIFPLSLSPKLDDNQNVSTLPSSSGFEELVQAGIRPPGPSRAEEVSLEQWGSMSGAEYADLPMKMQKAVGEGDVKVYKLVAGVGKEEYYIAGLDADGERILVVRVSGLKS